jgi:hypothetical protein
LRWPPGSSDLNRRDAARFQVVGDAHSAQAPPERGGQYRRPVGRVDDARLAAEWTICELIE